MSFEEGADNPFEEDEEENEDVAQKSQAAQSEEVADQTQIQEPSIPTRDPREIARQLTPEEYDGLRVPYVTWRSGTSANRKKMYFDVSESALDMEKQAKLLVEDDLGTSINKADLREFALAYAYHHPQALAKMAKEWGLQY